MRLTGTSRDPVAIGGFELRRGRFDLLGQRLEFTRGFLDFSGDLVPFLDFVAETQTSDATVSISVSGPANDPAIRLSSTPELPQDEILSRILFDRAAGGLFRCAGRATCAGYCHPVWRWPPAYSINCVARSASTASTSPPMPRQPAVGVSRYVADNVRIGVRAGARPEDTGVSVDIDLTRRLRLQSQVGADGRSSVGIGYEIEY